MLDEKHVNSGFRKKYLYLDKFTTHQKEDQEWKVDTMNIMNRQAKAIILAGSLGLLALSIAIAAFFK